MMKAGPSQEDIRRHNLGTLLRFVHLRGPASRATLAESLGLNRSTIMALTADLTAAGLVREELPRGPGRRAGRPSLVVRPESTRVYVLAFEVGVDRLVVARVGLGGVVLDRREGPRARDSDPSDLLSVLVAGARSLVRKAERDAVCVGAALGFPGTVRRSDDTIMFGPNLDVGSCGSGTRCRAASASASRSRCATTPTSAPSPSTSAVPGSAATTSSTCTATSASAAASSPTAGSSAATRASAARSVT